MAAFKFHYDRTGQITFASGSYGTSTVTYDSNSNRLTAGGINYTCFERLRSQPPCRAYPVRAN